MNLNEGAKVEKKYDSRPEYCRLFHSASFVRITLKKQQPKKKTHSSLSSDENILLVSLPEARAP